MNELYNEFIDAVKKKNRDNDITILNIIDSDEINIKNNDSILEIKEYKKEFLTIGIVLLQKEVIEPIDYSDVDNIEIKSNMKYYSKIMLTDSKYEIDNIMVKKYDKLNDAKDYYNYLLNIVEQSDLQELLKILKDNI